MPQETQQPIRISVVIPAYNIQDYIARAIKSVLDQTHPAEEIIVVDDGSTDNTAQKIKSFGSKIVYLHKENGGLSSARNAGIKAAKYQWITFLDGDDEWLGDYLKKQYQLLSQNPNLMWSTANFYRCLCDEDRRGPAVDPNKAKKLLKGKSYFDNYFYASSNKVSGSANTMIINQKIFDQVGLFNEQLTFAEDLDMWFRITYKFPETGFIAEPLAVYHMSRTGALSDTFKRSKLDHLCQLVSNHLTLADQNNQLTEFKSLTSVMVTSWIRGLFFTNRPNDIRMLIRDFGDLLSNRFKLLTSLALICPRATAAFCHMVSKIVRTLKLRKQIVREPEKA